MIIQEGMNKNYTITVEFRDYETAKSCNFINLIECIKATANPGHTFNVVVDPDSKDSESFCMDGDGPFHIGDISVTKFKEL